MTVTLWKLLLRLPTELFGVTLLSMLELQDCVRLDSAAADNQGRLSLKQAFFFYRTQGTIEVDQHDSEKLKWMLERSIRGINLSVSESFDYRKTFGGNDSAVMSISVVVQDEQSILAELSSVPQIAMLIKTVQCFDGTDIECLKDVPRLLQNVEHLEWRHTLEAEAWCAQLLANNPRLKTLRITAVEQLISVELAAAAIARVGQLEELMLTFSNAHSDADSLTLHALAVAAAAVIQLPLRKLFVLSAMENSMEIDAEMGWLPLVQRCPLLQELTLQGVDLLEEDAAALVEACPCLQSLNCMASIVTDGMLDFISAANLPLKSIHMCWAVTSLGAVERAATLLSCLNTAELPIESHESSVVATLSAALELMTSLKKLTFSGPAECLAALARGTFSLTHLILSEVSINDDVDDADDNNKADTCLCLIAQRNPSLVELCVYEATAGLTDALLKALAAHCPGLEAVALNDPYTVSDVGVIALAEGCPRLKRVTFSGARLLTDASVLALAKGCPRLIYFSCRRSTAVTEGALVHLFHRCCCLRLLRASFQSMTRETAAILTQQRAGFSFSG